VGTTGKPYIALAWDPQAQLTRAIIDTYTPLGTPPTPKLATIDLCNAILTAGPALTLNGVQVRRSEGLARNPDGGAFAITFGTSGTGASTEFLSESNGTVDVATGAVTLRGNHQTLQDDGDSLFYLGDVLHLHDVASASNAGALYRINPTTGAATLAVNVGPRVLRLAWDPTRGVLFCAYGEANGTARGLCTLNPTTGVFTKLGPDLPNTLYPGQSFVGLLSAPEPVCP
jgi:hypothetical protein